MAQALRKAEAVSRSPEREQLAARIDRVKALRDRRDRLRRGIEENPPHRALAAVDRAEEMLKTARESDAARTYARILGDHEPEGPTIEEASAALDAANSEYERISHADKVLKEGEAETVRDLGYAEQGLHQAIAEVAKPALNQLLADFEAAKKKLEHLRLTLSGITRVLDRDQLRLLQSEKHFSDVSADPAWAGWIAALEQDADAPAPALD